MKISLLDRIEEILIELIQAKKKAIENNEKSQSRQKKYHDEKIKRKSVLNIGNKVLLYDAAKAKQWSSKLKEKWKGSYYIYDKLLNESYKLKNLKGNILKTPINGKLLKKYYSRQNYISYITI